MNDTPDPSRAVLIVEDEALVAMFLEDMLAGAGYRPVWEPDGHRAALARHEAALPAAAVVDLGSAGRLDGRDVIRRLRERRPGLPVVVVTGYDRLAPQSDLRGLGGPTVRLGKPIDTDALLAQLAGVLDRSAAPVAPRRRRSEARPAGAAA